MFACLLLTYSVDPYTLKTESCTDADMFGQRRERSNDSCVGGVPRFPMPLEWLEFHDVAPTNHVSVCVRVSPPPAPQKTQVLIFSKPCASRSFPHSAQKAFLLPGGNFCGYASMLSLDTQLSLSAPGMTASRVRLTLCLAPVTLLMTPSSTTEPGSSEPMMTDTACTPWGKGMPSASTTSSPTWDKQQG